MYIVDLGLRNHILPRRQYDLGFSLENIAYFELLRRGYRVMIGKIGSTEVDFVAEKQGTYTYFQVTADMTAQETFEREMKPLRRIRDNYEKIVYEGYGPSGVAVIVETMTDNRNRTAGEIRHYFDKYGGNMGAANCVSWSFDKKGVIVIDNEDEELDEDDVMMEVLDAGADDFEPDGETFVVYTAPDDVSPVAEKISAAGYKLLSAQVEMLPQNGYIKLTNEDDIKNMQKMLDMFEDNDDVQNV